MNTEKVEKASELRVLIPFHVAGSNNNLCLWYRCGAHSAHTLTNAGTTTLRQPDITPHVKPSARPYLLINLLGEPGDDDRLRD